MCLLGNLALGVLFGKDLCYSDLSIMTVCKGEKAKKKKDKEAVRQIES